MEINQNSTAHSIALVDLDLKLKGMDAKIVCTMHMVKIDEIFVEAKSGIAETVAPILKDTMEDAGRSFLKIVPVEAEVVIADSWRRNDPASYTSALTFDILLVYLLGGWWLHLQVRSLIQLRRLTITGRKFDPNYKPIFA